MTIIGFQITEKSTSQVEDGKYCFWVKPKASKQKIKQAVEERFKVKVEKVNIISVQGKTKNWRQKEGKKKDRKKAIVSLKKGQMIKEFETNE